MSKDTEPAQLKHKIYNWNNGRNYKKNRIYLQIVKHLE